MSSPKVIRIKHWRTFWYNVGRFFGWPPCVPQPWRDLNYELSAMSDDEQASVVVDYAVYGTDLATAIQKKRKNGPHLVRKSRNDD